MMSQLYSRKKRGVAALVVVFLIGAATFLMVYQGAFLGLGDLENSVTVSKGSSTLLITDGCLEEALRQLRLSPNYIGITNMQVSGGSCTITVTPVDFVTRTIIATGKVSGAETFCRQIEARAVVFNKTVTLTSWAEKVNWVTPSC